MHPPFGFALFYLRSVAPKRIRTADIYWGAVPFVLIQVIMVTLIIAFPGLVSYGNPKAQATRQAPTGLTIEQIRKNEGLTPDSDAPAEESSPTSDQDDLAKRLLGQ